MSYIFENPHLSQNNSSDFELVNTLALIRSASIGPISFYDLISKYKTPSIAYSELTEKYKKSGKKICTLDDAKIEIEKTQKYGAKIISVFSEQYPKILANIADAPPIISVLGKAELLQQNLNCVAMVGARNASALAMKFAEITARDLAKNNLCIASGLARGIDFAAHKGALAEKAQTLLPTIAVIAGGIDNIYPKENEKLYKQISENGVIISENIFGAAPKADSFPRRNRIISGLSLVTILIEAAIKSGSLITAKFAAEQGREVACVPGFPLDPRSGGTNMLIKNGANLIENANDVLQILQNLPMDFSSQISAPTKTNLFSKNNIEPDLFEPAKPSSNKIISSNDIFLENLSANPVHIDEIIKQTQLSAAQVNSLLMEFEMEGKITRHAGNKVSLAV